MLSRALKMTFWVLYDHVGKLILANLIWAVVLCIPGALGMAAVWSQDPALAITVGVPCLLVTLGVALPVMSVGLAHMAKTLIETKDGSIRDMFVGIKRYGLRAIGLGSFYLLASCCLAVSVWFYADKLRGVAPWLGYAISALALWCLVLLALTYVFAAPALVQKNARVVESLKLATMLVLDNPVFCIGLGIQFFALAGLSVIPVFFLLFSGATTNVLASSAYEMLARKYAAIQQRQTGTLASDRPIHVVSRNGTLVFDDANDDYLNRGLRDALFPWKG